VAGIDEAGRGPLAGPLLVAAVILDPARHFDGLDDSKKLTEARRLALAPHIREQALAFTVFEISPERIDALNIFQATMAGMREALAGLSVLPELARFDGNKLPKDLRCVAEAVVGGDGRHAEIAAASILAKVARDARMVEIDAECPGYGFAQHKGYPTPEHLDALKRLGPCRWHRRSYAPVRAVMMPSLGF